MAQGQQFDVLFTPPGPISAAFYESQARIRAIMGPVGSAKTSTALMSLLMNAFIQTRSPIDGVRYSKWAVIRDTYRNLAKTTIPSWQRWVPRTLPKPCEWRGGSSGEPAHQKLIVNIGSKAQPDIVNTQFQFIGLGDQSAEDAMRGWEGTGALINEADRTAPEVLAYVNTRLRYPPEDHGGPRWKGVLLDFNAPDDDNWIYDKFITNLPPGWEFYRQPGGLEAGAENLENLPKNYYEDQMVGQPEWLIRRMVHNRFGYSREGKPVYSEFNDNLHVAPAPLRPTPGLPILLGGDGGLTPAVICAQRTLDGAWRLIHEICGVDTSAETFGPTVAAELERLFPGYVYKAWGDPSGAYKHETSENTWLEIMSYKTGIRWKAAPCDNKDYTLREAGPRSAMSRMIGGQPAFLMSPTMRVLRKALNSGYHYKRRAVGGGNFRFEDRPCKDHPASDVANAMEYVFVGGGEYKAVMGRRAAQAERRRPTVAKSDFSVFG